MMMDIYVLFSDYRQRDRTSGVFVRGRKRAVLRSRGPQQSRRSSAESSGTGPLQASAGRRLRDVFHRSQQTGSEDRVSPRVSPEVQNDKIFNELTDRPNNDFTADLAPGRLIYCC